MFDLSLVQFSKTFFIWPLGKMNYLISYLSMCVYSPQVKERVNICVHVVNPLSVWNILEA